MKIKEKEQMLVVGTVIRTSNATPEQIAVHWERFWSKKTQDTIPNKKSDDILGVYLEYESDHTASFTHLIGCEVTHAEDLPNGLTSKIIPAAKYAVFTAKGKFPDCVVQTWQEIWESHLDRKYTADFEVYGASFLQDPPQVPIYISIN